MNNMNSKMNFRNIFVDTHYLINPDLQHALECDRLYDDNRLLDKNCEGIYWVIFRALKKDTNVLVYNCIYYPALFLCLFVYFLFRDRYKNNEGSR